MQQVKPAPAAITLLLVLIFSGLATSQDESGYSKALARYTECISRLPFRFHVEGREKIAETREVAALAQLKKDYAKSKKYSEYARYTIAEIPPSFACRLIFHI